MSGHDLEGVAGIEELVEAQRQVLLSPEMRRMLVAAGRPGTTIELDFSRPGQIGTWAVKQGHYQWAVGFVEATVNALWGEGLIARASTGARVYSITDAGRSKVSKLGGVEND